MGRGGKPPLCIPNPREDNEWTLRWAIDESDSCSDKICAGI